MVYNFFEYGFCFVELEALFRQVLWYYLHVP